MKKTAFTLVEILLALAILGIGLVGILSVFVVGTNSIRRTVTMTEASFLAQMVIADFRQKGYENTAPSEYKMEEFKNSLGEGMYSDYSCDIKIEDAKDVKDLRRIDLAIKNKNKKDKEPIAEFTTYISKYEP